MYLFNFVWSAVFATVSATVYVISFPVASYLGSPVNVYDQFPAMLFVSSASSATTCSATTPLVSLLITCNLILFNVYTSAASLSIFDHTLLAGTITSGFTTTVLSSPSSIVPSSAVAIALLFITPSVATSPVVTV